MQTVSSASRTCLRDVSAVECTATVLMPSSRQARYTRRAISPRFAIRTFSSKGALALCVMAREPNQAARPSARAAARVSGAGSRGQSDIAIVISPVGRSDLDHKERLAELDGIAVLDEDADDLAGDLRFDLVHHLHGFDDAERVAGFDLGPDLDERLRPRAGARVERADHRRRDLVAFLRLARGLRSLLLRGLLRRRVVLRREAHQARVRVAADPHRFLAL